MSEHATHHVSLYTPEPGVSGWECKAQGCTHRATHRIVWKRKKGAALSYRCHVHAKEFAKRHGLTCPEPPPGGCSRCGGSGVDPDSPDCTCDCCGGSGTEYVN